MKDEGGGTERRNGEGNGKESERLVGNRTSQEIQNTLGVVGGE